MKSGISSGLGTPVAGLYAKPLAPRLSRPLRHVTRPASTESLRQNRDRHTNKPFASARS